MPVTETTNDTGIALPAPPDYVLALPGKGARAVPSWPDGGYIERLRLQRFSRQRLGMALAGRPDISERSKGLSVMKAARDRAVFSGLFDGAPAMLKIHWGETASWQASREFHALAYHAPRFVGMTGHGGAGLGMAKPLAEAAEVGLLVIEKQPGQPLRSHIRDGHGFDHEITADWLNHYYGQGENWRRVAPFGRGYWMKQVDLEIAAAKQPAALPLLRQMRAQMQLMSAGLTGEHATQAHIHGDFSQENILWDGVTLTGIDIEPRKWGPIAMDVARYLMTALPFGPAQGPRFFGMQTKVLAPFLAHPNLLRPTDQTRILPFLIGVELVRRLSALRSKSKLDSLAETTKLFLQDAQNSAPSS